VPDIPDQATKDATTRRITAHIHRGWPHLGQPVISFRGQFCYYQGHIDRWKIAIYKYSTESYTEAEPPCAGCCPRTWRTTTRPGRTGAHRSLGQAWALTSHCLHR
jgi:hypothetical protein